MDKLKQSVSVVPEFVAGEQPTAAKFNSIGAQLQRAARELEKAVGDTNDQSWPYSSTTETRLTSIWGRRITTGVPLSGTARPLNIANLARLIGPASNLNPRMLGTQTVTETYDSGVHEFALRYPPSTVPVFDDTSLVTSKSLYELTEAGDYHVTSEGKVYCATATVGGSVTYSTVPVAWASGQNYSGATFNVMPDPSQTQTGDYQLVINAVDGNGRYLVELPLVSHQQSDILGLTSILSSKDINADRQLTLPDVLTNGDIEVDEAIPEGFLYLRNNTTNKVYTDATYLYVDNVSFRITNVDLDAALAALDEFSVITVGCEITTSIDDLRQKMFHTHDRTFGEPFAKLEGISGLLAAPGDSGPFVPSEIPGNFAPQYLHRDGWGNAFPADINMNDQNAMRGPLVFGYTASPAGDKLNPVILDAGPPEVRDWRTGGVYFGSGSHYIERNLASNIEYSAFNAEHEFIGGPLKAEEGARLGSIASSPDSPFKVYLEESTILEEEGTQNVSLSSALQSKTIFSITVLLKPSAGAFAAAEVDYSGRYSSDEWFASGMHDGDFPYDFSYDPSDYAVRIRLRGNTWWGAAYWQGDPTTATVRVTVVYTD